MAMGRPPLSFSGHPSTRHSRQLDINHAPRVLLGCGRPLVVLFCSDGDEHLLCDRMPRLPSAALKALPLRVGCRGRGWYEK